MSISDSGRKGIQESTRRVLASLVLLLCLAWLTPLWAAETPFVMGVFPRKGFTTTLESFTPLAEYLSEKLDRKVVVKSSRNFAEFWHGLSQRQYDLVHYNQYHYVRSKKQFGYEVITKNEENHQSTMSGALIVRNDSGINDVADLRGKKIVFGGGPRAMQSYIVPAFLLQQAGLRQIDYEFAFAETPANSIYAVYYRQASAAGSADVNLDLPVVHNRVDTSSLKILARGESLAHLPWAVKKELPQELKQKIKILLTSLNASSKGRAILKRANLTAVLAAEDKEYDPHRRIINRVLGENY